MVNNYERIKSMTIEEMSKFINSLIDENSTYCIACNRCINYNTHHYYERNGGCEDCEYYDIGSSVLDWLKSDLK